MTKKAPPAVEPAPTRVEIATGNHQIVVESTDPLRTVARKALELWNATDSPQGAVTAAVGFAACEPDPQSTLMPPELTLPHRIATQEGPDEDQRTRHRPGRRTDHR